MQKTLLTTKLNVSKSQQTLVFRSGLMSILAKARTHRLTLVSAPPGYGKTTLLSSWLLGNNLVYTWLSLDDGDNDPIRFLEYFLTALHKVVPTIRVEMLDLLQGNQASSFEALVAHLINEITGIDDFFLVLDDFQVIQAQPVLDMFIYLLEHMPTVMHVVFLSRTDPPLPLSRLRARGQLLEIRAEQLRFTVDEITHFFKNIMGLKLNDEDVSALEERTEGWIAGLQLAALAMQGLSSTESKDTHSFVVALSGSHTYIMDYLTDEVLRQLTDKTRSFLIQTSILDRMSGALCEAVVKTSTTEPIDGQAMLEEIEQNHLFVIPLDSERRWYRYHHLFKDVLNRRLEAQVTQPIPELHGRASVWYEQNGLIHEAIQHAMKSGDSERTVRLVEQHGCNLLIGGESITLADWLASIEPFIQSRPWLAMQKAWVLLFTGHPEQAEKMIGVGETLIAPLEPTDEVRTLLGSFTAARAHWANMQGKASLAADYAQRAINDLPDSTDFSCSLRSVATSLLGDSNWAQGKLNEARRAYTDAIRISQLASNPHLEVMSKTNLAGVLFEQGQLHQAARTYSEALRLAEHVDGPDSPYAHKIHFGLSGVFYTWNRLDDAMSSIEQCIRLCQQWRDVDLQAACLVRLAQLERARGNAETAHEAMCDAEELIHSRQLSPRWSMWVESALACLWLDQGKAEEALFLVRSNGVWTNSSLQEAISHPGIFLVDEISYLLEPVYLILLRLFLVQGNPDAVLSLCKRLLPLAETGEWLGREIELLILQALAYQSKKNIPGALEALKKAISLAEPEQFTRVFVDEGEHMVKLLYQAKAHQVGGRFAADLLSFFDRPAFIEPSSAQPIQNLLVEPLSARELEVLKCIAEGFSNQEIAEQFVISPKTVKRHISNIYGKLEAKNRTRAVSIARELKIL